MKLDSLKDADIILFKEMSAIGYDELTQFQQKRASKVMRALQNGNVSGYDLLNYVDRCELTVSKVSTH